MTNKKEAAPMLAHRKRQGTGTLVVPSVPTYNNTMKSGGVQVRVADYLHQGQQHAISRRELEGILQMDGREIRKQIEIERRQGVPILSDCKRGYFLAESPEEVTAFVCSMRHRAQEIMTTASTIESAGGCL